MDIKNLQMPGLLSVICRAYAEYFQDSDPVCNIISANAAAGGIGIGENEVAKIINSYGITDAKGSERYLAA